MAHRTESDPHATWAAAFLGIAMLPAIALAIFWLMRPRELAGDRTKSVS
jgi:hypothetical protein